MAVTPVIAACRPLANHSWQLRMLIMTAEMAAAAEMVNTIRIRTRKTPKTTPVFLATGYLCTYLCSDSHCATA